MNWWQTFLNSPIGIAALVSAVASFITSKFINLSVQKKIEVVKKENAIELAQYGAILNTELESHRSERKFWNDRLNSLHSKRLDITKEFYSKLLKLYYIISWNTINTQHADNKVLMMVLNKTLNKHTESANDMIFIVNEYFNENKIYFGSELCEKIDLLLTDLLNIIMEVLLLKDTTAMKEIVGALPADYNEKINKRIAEHGNKLETVIKAAMEEIENEFRTIIGVNS